MRWPTATARSTSSSARFARSWSARRPAWGYIHTHFGVGYRFDPERTGEAAVAEPAVPPPASPVITRADDGDASLLPG